MKNQAFPHAAVVAMIGMIAPLAAQNLVNCPSAPSGYPKPAGMQEEASRFGISNDSAMPGSYEVPEVDKVLGEVTDEPPVFHAQDALNLKDKSFRPRDFQSLLKLDVLRRPSPFRKLLASGRLQPYEVVTDSLQTGLAEISAAYREAGKSESTADCTAIARSIAHRAQAEPEKLLETVEREVAANPNCACEVVKAAITASDAETEQVVAIAETAIHAAPESMRIISQCAIAASPESISAIQAMLTRIDPNAGETGYSAKSSKSAKGEKVASVIAPPLPNPLDLPPAGPPITPPPIYPPKVTDVDPCR
jgi:hypothetical protein